MRLVIGSDHAGFYEKRKIKEFLERRGYQVDDLGPHTYDPDDDYPKFALAVAQKVAATKGSKGILICGTGTGMVIAANKVKGVRAATIYDRYSARKASEDNDANIVAIRGRKTSVWRNKRLLLLWLGTQFSTNPRYRRRINQVNSFEDKR